MKRLLVVTMILVFIFNWGAYPAKAAAPQPLYFEKVCGAIPNTCVIDFAASPLEFLTNATIEYTDHTKFMNDAGIIHEAASIFITATDGSTAVGHVSWVWMNGEMSGTVTIQPGTGALASFHANAKIDVITWPTRFSFTGTYFFTP